MHFTQEDYKKIESWLLRNSVKDTEFQEALPLTGDESVVITQDNHNRNLKIKDFVDEIIKVGIADFLNITERYKSPNITLKEAIALVPDLLRKKGQVITFSNPDGNWEIYQFTGALNQWNNVTLWEDVFNIDKYIINSILPDEEDLTKSEVDKNGNSFLSLKDREYNPTEFSGLGRVILRKKIAAFNTPSNKIERRNILVKEDITKSNTVYEIRYDFDLHGDTIVIPNDCILYFNGGSIKNGKLILNNTLVYPLGIIKEDVLKCTIEGNFKKGQMFFDKEQGHLSIWDGTNWKTRLNYRVIDNKLNETLDGGKTWTPISDYIASYFRWGPNNTIQINRTLDNSKWENLSGEFADSVFIKGYKNTYSELPQNPSLGDIYMVGAGAPYTMYVSTSEGWKDNGQFTSISAGVVQTTGQSTTEVMSQKAVTDKLTELESETIGLHLSSDIHFTKQEVKVAFDNLLIKAGQTFNFCVSSASEFSYFGLFYGSEWSEASKKIIENAANGKTYSFTAKEDITSIKAFLITASDYNIDVTISIDTEGRIAIIEDSIEALDVVTLVKEIKFAAQEVREAFDDIHIKAGTKFSLTFSSSSSYSELGVFYGSDWSDWSRVLLRNAVNGTTYTFIAKEDITSIKVFLISASNYNIAIDAQLSVQGRLSALEEKFNNLQITTEQLQDGAVTVEKLSFTEPGKNKFNKDKYSVGVLLNGELFSEYPDFTTSDYIPVKPNANYVLSVNGIARANDRTEIYDANKVYIGNLTDIVLPMPSNARYCRFSLNFSPSSDQWASVQFEEGNDSSAYEPYHLVISNEVLPSSIAELDELEESIKDVVNLEKKKELSFSSMSVQTAYSNLGIKAGETFLLTFSSESSWSQLGVFYGATWSEYKKVLIDSAINGKTYEFTATEDINDIKVFLISAPTFNMTISAKYEKFGRLSEVEKAVEDIVTSRSAILPYLSNKADALVAGSSLAISSAPNTKNHHVIGCNMAITEMGRIRISHGLDTYAFGMVEIDDTNVYEYITGNTATPAYTNPHGLEISDFLNVAVRIGTSVARAELVITSLAGSVSKTINWMGCTGQAILTAVSGSYSNVELSMGGNAYKKDVWFFGDSYADYWPPVLYQKNVTDFHLDAFSGRNSAAALTSLQNALKLGTPKVLVWMLGMNDGDGSAINASYESVFNSVKTICKNMGIAFVPCTIPNCPVVNNYYKNAYVRANAEHYIDMAKILGADYTDSTWYDGLIAADNVHPSEKGKVVIANAILASGIL